jgi:D-alanyl-D-alanine carboxypeptidase (penicillin-binding protein 5/6)
MKKIVNIILVTFLLMLYTSIDINAAEPLTSGQAAILMDGGSGRVLYEQNADHKMPMASTTKIMTALVALEYGVLTDEVIVPPEAQGVEGSSIWLSAGETHTLENLLYGLMLRSGNDAATAIAYHIGGSIEGFATIMNEKARSIGAVNSNFMNPHGLHHDQHYTTARDLGKITVYAMKNPDFVKIVSSRYKTIPWEGHQWDRAMQNKNKLLWQYEGANGVKTGYTKKAGRCLVSAAKRDELQLVAVVLNCGPMFEDSGRLLDYGFRNFSNYTVVRQGETLESLPVKGGKLKELSLIASKDYSIALRKSEYDKIRVVLNYPDFVEAPIFAGEQIGHADIYLNNEKMSEIPLYAANSIEKKSFWDFITQLLNYWRK